MSGVWGTGEPRCQAALAVLASLCRARPPPLGLDVETCRSFELEPPERSPSAADSGNRKAEAPSLPSFSPWLSQLSKAAGPEPRNPDGELRLGIRDSDPAWSSALAYRPQGKWRDTKGTGRDRIPPAPSRETLRGPRGKRAPGTRCPKGLSFPRVFPLAQRAICQGRGPWGEQQTKDIPAEEVNSSLGRCRGPGVRRSVCPSVYLFSRGRRPESPWVSRGETWVCGWHEVFVSGCLRLPAAFCVSAGGGGAAGGGVGEGVAASSRPPPAPITRSLGLPLTHSDSGAGARLSRCLSPTLPSGRLLPERRGPCAGRSPRRPPSPGGSPSRAEPAGAGESRARAPRGRGPAHSCGVSRESRQLEWRVAPWRPEPREGGWRGSRPAAGIYLRHRRRAAALARCSRASLSGSRRLEGPGREGHQVAFPPGGRGWRQCEASRECGVGVGRSCGDRDARVPWAPQTPALLVPRP